MKNILWLFSILLLFVSLATSQTPTVKEAWSAMPNGKIVPGVLLAGQPAAQTAGVEVQVYDYASLQPSTFKKFAQGTLEILSGTGISIKVVLCERTTADSCGSTDNRHKLVLRLAPGSAKKMKNAFYSPLGCSLADHSGGKYASLFLETIKDQASDANVPWLTVLDYAAAHEIGHLLLGDQAHTPRGIMKARWDWHDYMDMYQGRLKFSDEQIRQLRKAAPVAATRRQIKQGAISIQPGARIPLSPALVLPPRPPTTQRGRFLRLLALPRCPLLAFFHSIDKN